MKIDDWFNSCDIEHVRAYKTLIETGSWPDGFIPEGMSFSSLWQIEILNKLAMAWIVWVTHVNPEVD